MKLIYRQYVAEKMFPILLNDMICNAKVRQSICTHQIVGHYEITSKMQKMCPS